jgi:transcriptional antiterminator RfaH
MNTWFLIYCKPKQENRAEENLKRQGFDVFNPSIKVVKNTIGLKSVVKSEPLFPRYLFIKTDPNIKSVAPISSTFGVANFVKFGDRHATAPDSLISEIKFNLEKQIAFIGSREAIQKGDEIYVSGHGFDQMKAIYCNPCGNMRAIILMNILGKETKLLVPLESLAKTPC